MCMQELSDTLCLAIVCSGTRSTRLRAWSLLEKVLFMLVVLQYSRHYNSLDYHSIVFVCTSARITGVAKDYSNNCFLTIWT